MSELNLTTQVAARHKSGRIVFAVIDDSGDTRGYMIDDREDKLFQNLNDALEDLDGVAAREMEDATE